MAFASSPRTTSRATAIASAAALLLAACGSSATSAAEEADTSAAPAAEAEASALASPISIQNDGTSQWEGHTPRGFAGMGTGLFAGDNLNSGFPEGEGIQILLTFALPDGTGVPGTAVLNSEVLRESGNAFEALGELQAATVSYEQFGAELFNIEPTSDLTTCTRPGDGGFTCDVSQPVQDVIESGAERVQLRLTFEQLADNDGEQDLALFFITDSNTNEPGIFTLDLS